MLGITFFKDGNKKHSRMESRNLITESIIKEMFGRKPIQPRRLIGDDKFKPECNIFNLVMQEIHTVYFYIDNNDHSGYSESGRRIVVNLLKKYKKHFKDFPDEYIKINDTIETYRRKK